jgi:hypothetical protein
MDGVVVPVALKDAGVLDVGAVQFAAVGEAEDVDAMAVEEILDGDGLTAAVEGRLPRGIGVERLGNAPTEWSRQFEALGLNPQ